MTEEDAIRRIEDFGLYHAIKDLPYSTRTVEAFEMAIEALKQQRTNKPRKGEWIPCSERLPEENVYVLVWCGEVRIARIIRGISKEQRAKMQEGAINNPVSYGWNLSNGYFEAKRSESYRACDENGNNKVPYCWNCIYGDMFGQDVKAWMPLPKPYMKEGEEE